MDWGSGQRYLETLSLAPEAVHLDSLNAGAPVLDTHNLYSSGDVLGHVADGSAVLSPTEGRCRTVWDLSDEKAAKIYRKAKAGHIRGVSVGYEVHRYDVVSAGEGRIEQRIAVDWTPREVSICPVGADPGAGVRRGGPTAPCSLSYRTQSTGTPTMELPKLKLGKRDMAAAGELAASITAMLKSATLKSDSDFELMGWKLAALSMGGTPTPADPPAEEVAVVGEMAADNAAIAEAARKATGLRSKEEIVEKLLSMSVRSERVSTMSAEMQARKTKEREARVRQAKIDGFFTPAKEKDVLDWFRDGTIAESRQDQWLDQELGRSEKQINTDNAEPPAPRVAATTHKQTPEDVMGQPLFQEYCRKQKYDDKESKLFAQSWVNVNGNRAFEMPSKLL